MLKNLINSYETFIALYSTCYIVLYAYFLYKAIIIIKYYYNTKHILSYDEIIKSEDYPGISVIAPAFNEEVTIVENVKSLLSLEYPKYEVILINDGSTDNSLQLLIENYELVKIEKFYVEKIKTQQVRGFYKSINPKYKRLIVVDKVNGGCKADATNAGMNVSKYEMVVSTDVDCILRKDTLFVLSKPFITSPKKVIATGAAIRAVNSCEVKNGQLIKINYPKNFYAAFQEIEYMRSFVFGRMAMTSLDATILVSGGLGLFDKQTVFDAGGYYETSLAEDLDLILRMRKIMHERNQDFTVGYVPESLCWTEVPATNDIFVRQRVRWARGLIQTLHIHKNLFFNRKYGITGMFSYPYFVFFEFLVPILELIGLIVLVLDLVFFTINYKHVLIISLFVYLFYMLINLATLYIDQLARQHYRSTKQIAKKIIIMFFEPFVYHPITLYTSLKGYYLYIFNKEQKWGVMTRSGFGNNKT